MVDLGSSVADSGSQAFGVSADGRLPSAIGASHGCHRLSLQWGRRSASEQLATVFDRSGSLASLFDKVSPGEVGVIHKCDNGQCFHVSDDDDDGRLIFKSGDT